MFVFPLFVYLPSKGTLLRAVACLRKCADACARARVCVCVCAGQREIETREEWAAIYSKRKRGGGGREGEGEGGGGGGGGVRVCAIEQPPVMRGSMLTRMVSNTAWGNSSFTPRLKPSSLFCLPSSVNISLSPGTDSGVNRNQIMHTNTSVTQDFQQSFCLSLFLAHKLSSPTRRSLSLSILDYPAEFLSITELCVTAECLCVLLSSLARLPVLIIAL